MSEENEVSKNDKMVVSQTQNMLTITKSNMHEAVAFIVNMTRSGEYDPLRGFLFFKKMAEFAKQGVEAMKPLAEDSIRLSKGESYFLLGTEITKKASGTKYDYAICNDTIWNDLNAMLQKTIEAMKMREEFLKGVKEPFDFVDEETGDMWRIYPVNRTGTESINVSIK